MEISPTKAWNGSDVVKNIVLGLLLLLAIAAQASSARLRLIIETDAGGDPDDEQSFVRFLLCANEWDIEGIIANRPTARDGENHNPERTGLGIVRRLLKAYGECQPNLALHDPRYPTLDSLWQRTVAGHDGTDDAVNLIIASVDKADARPLWYSDWGTDLGAATNNLRRALDRVLRERGVEGYAKFKSRLRLASADAFGPHATSIAPTFPLWVDTFRPELGGRRWYHRFSALTAKAGGFDVARDCLTGHGPLGALYPTNTTHWQKEGDTMTFLYLVPTGMNDPEQPTWGSWAGRYGLNTNFSGKPYYWASPSDVWNGATNRDNIVARWAADLQNDFRARLDWCVRSFAEANHPPAVVVNGSAGKSIVHRNAAAGAALTLSAEGTTDPDSDALTYEWFVYPEAGTYEGDVQPENVIALRTAVKLPVDAAGRSIHVVVAVRDNGQPPLAGYRRVVVHATSKVEK
jgi:hypothetical protein